MYHQVWHAEEHGPSTWLRFQMSRQARFQKAHQVEDARISLSKIKRIMIIIKLIQKLMKCLKKLIRKFIKSFQKALHVPNPVPVESLMTVVNSINEWGYKSPSSDNKNWERTRDLSKRHDCLYILIFDATWQSKKWNGQRKKTQINIYLVKNTICWYNFKKKIKNRQGE